MSDKHFASVVLGLSFDGADGATSVTDWGSTGHTITFAGNAQLDTAQTRWGSASLLLDGNGDYCTVPDHADWSFGSAPFTVEGWMRFNGLNASERGCCLLGQYNNTGNQLGWGLYYSNDGGSGTWCSSAPRTARAPPVWRAPSRAARPRSTPGITSPPIGTRPTSSGFTSAGWPSPARTSARERDGPGERYSRRDRRSCWRSSMWYA